MSGLIDMVGFRVGRVVVLSFAEKDPSGQHWNCLCDCGEVFPARGDNLRTARPTYACPLCRPRSRRGSLPTCKVCGSREHNRLHCPNRLPGDSVLCRCAGMKHRREAPTCPECGGAYEPEPPMTVAEVHALPFQDRRVA